MGWFWVRGLKMQRGKVEDKGCGAGDGFCVCALVGNKGKNGRMKLDIPRGV